MVQAESQSSLRSIWRRSAIRRSADMAGAAAGCTWAVAFMKVSSAALSTFPPPGWHPLIADGHWRGAWRRLAYFDIGPDSVAGEEQPGAVTHSAGIGETIGHVQGSRMAALAEACVGVRTAACFESPRCLASWATSFAVASSSIQSGMAPPGYPMHMQKMSRTIARGKHVRYESVSVGQRPWQTVRQIFRHQIRPRQRPGAAVQPRPGAGGLP